MQAAIYSWIRLKSFPARTFQAEQIHRRLRRKTAQTAHVFIPSIRHESSFFKSILSHFHIHRSIQVPFRQGLSTVRKSWRIFPIKDVKDHIKG
jgi:hypothetical protein